MPINFTFSLLVAAIQYLSEQMILLCLLIVEILMSQIELKHKIHETLKNRKISIIILTHIDDDHIGGIQVLLDDQEFLDLLS